jgi:hypothetical protein
MTERLELHGPSPETPPPNAERRHWDRRLPENGGLRQALEDLNRRLEGIDNKLNTIEQRQYEHVEAIAALRVQSGIWGGLSGLVAAVAALITTYLLGSRPH